MRAALALLLLAACAPQGKPPPPSTCPPAAPAPACPSAPAPDACVTEWYAKAELPACVEAWMDRLTDHHRNKRSKHGKGRK